jgi:lysophospholipase L1-like esterase
VTAEPNPSQRYHLMIRSNGWPGRASWPARAAALVAGLSLLAGVAWTPVARHDAVPAADAAAGCRIYVAAGDDIPAGHDLNDDAKRYPEQLLEDHLIGPGWCVYNQGANGQTSQKFINDGGLAKAYNMRPDLITIQLGEQNDTIVNLIDSCFKKVRDHDFSGANACAAGILANPTLFDNLKKNYTTILQMTRIMASQRPQLVVAIPNYPNPYPQANAQLTAEITQLCVGVIDAMQSCLQRWLQLPPALLTIDKVFQKLNKALAESVAPFQAGPNGFRWVLVDLYPKFKGHEMKMDVTLKLEQVCHLCGTSGSYMDDHSSNKDLGSDDPWWIEGDTGRKFPEYLLVPGPLINPPVVIMRVSQTTEGMGVWVDADGQQCIADAIWDADTILPGTTPLKWLLGYGEPSKTDVCQ